jgi:hypothetical protein
LQCDFDLAFVWPIVAAKTNVLDLHGTSESMLRTGRLQGDGREELILAEIAKFAFDLQALSARRGD